MLRRSVTRPLTTTSRAAFTRPFSAIAARMAAGDTGAPRPGGAKASDEFQKREAAQENLYIHQKEQEKLATLKKKIEEQRSNLNELENNLNELSKGGDKK
ncbi:mitochondrial ATPase inhibitor, IATP-domain-containing protein [Aspergillus pseudoustus]|uniref:ATPase inhibitor, mitochondrial n=1 Tax=Aspergillus pseudoustus TaxID=1810923 RepID=A0ABR4JWS3_9EURO